MNEEQTPEVINDPRLKRGSVVRDEDLVLVDTTRYNVAPKGEFGCAGWFVVLVITFCLLALTSALIGG